VFVRLNPWLKKFLCYSVAKMKIIIAPNAFKETLSAVEVADCIEHGIRKIWPETAIEKFPLADGGDGTVDALVSAMGGKIIAREVTGPLGKKVRAEIGLLGDEMTAVVEMASASGLRLVPLQKRNPLRTTTYGTGELIKACLDGGAKKIIVGVGGSATVDGGAGMAMALGAKLLDKFDKPIESGGEGLKHLFRIDCSQLDSRIKRTKFIVASDVDNPLLGKQGAARVYAAQKGATPKMVGELEKYLTNFAQVVKKDLGVEVANLPGAGAAGGLGAGLAAFLNARIEQGVDIVIKAWGLKEKMKNADLVFTGEGSIDRQTLYGKVPFGVAKIAKKYGVPVIAIAGNVEDGAYILLEYGIEAIFSTTPRIMTLAEIRKNPGQLITNTVEQIMRIYRLREEGC
jgi:glycerate kinase